MSKQIKCTNCKSTRIAHSRPKRFDKLMQLIAPYKPYRCMQCMQRFWWRETLKDSSRVIFFWGGVLSLIILYQLLSMQLSGLRQQPVTEKTAAGFKRPAVKKAEPDKSPVKQVARSTAQLNTQFYGEQRTTPNVTLNQAIALEQEAVKQANQKQLALEQTLQKNDVEQRAIYHVQINNFLKRWKSAWEAGDVENYLKFYSKKFKPENTTYKQWRMSRAVKVMPSRNIKVLLGQPEIKFTDNMGSAQVSFRQQYRANDFEDVSYKTLLLERHGTEWLIVQEYESSDIGRG